MSNKYMNDIELTIENENTTIDILAKTIWGEARGESVRGKEAVASTIINRAKYAKSRGGYWWGNNVMEVCLKPSQYSCWNKDDPNYDKIILINNTDKQFKICTRIARRAFYNTQPDPTNDATHYHTISCKPWWAKGRKSCAIIGDHIFYKDIA